MQADEPLSRADAANIQLDSADQVNVVLTAGTLRPGGFAAADGRLDAAAVREELAARLNAGESRLRRFTQRPVVRPGADPVWRWCVPDLDWHVRVVEAPPGRDGLAQICARLMTTPLAANRPLWELLLLPGSPDQPGGFVLRFHHSVADGVRGVALAQQLLTGSEPSLPPTPAVPQSQRPRRRLGLGVVRSVALIWPRIGPTPLLGRITARRQVGFADTELAAVAASARSQQATINDAVLAAVARGVAAALADAGATVPRSVRASVPVALPDREGSGNATGVMMVDLPLRTTSLEDCLGLVAAQTRRRKQAAREQGTYELTHSRWSTWLFALLVRYQRFAALFVTNVRGPQQRLSLAGAEVESLWPVTPVQGNVRVSIAAMSYAGQLSCGIHTDLAAVSAASLTAALADAFDELTATTAR